MPAVHAAETFHSLYSVYGDGVVANWGDESMEPKRHDASNAVHCARPWAVHEAVHEAVGLHVLVMDVFGFENEKHAAFVHDLVP